MDLEGGGFLPYFASIFFFAIFRVTDRNMEANMEVNMEAIGVESMGLRVSVQAERFGYSNRVAYVLNRTVRRPE